MNSEGGIGPPTNPLPWLTAKVSILAIRMAASRPTPRVPPPVRTIVSWSLPENIVIGRATPTIPNTTPPSVYFAMAGTVSRPNSRAAAIMNPVRSVTTRAANRPCTTAADLD